ncbi:MAG: hypothetical protein D6726_02630 [Nitrospirae bacterium]|nr:MAG: hypothetical protein D6726_02630 [Nitrospirota bacterium]
MDRILRILEKGSVTTGEVASLSGLSRIRTLVTIGKLNREGALKVVKSVEQTEKPSEPTVSKTPQLQIKPLKLLFLFCNEKAATESVNSILSAFNQKQIKGIKAGVADFIRTQILDHPVHIFTLQGKRGFEFLYEPLLPTSDAALYLINCADDYEEYKYFLKKLDPARGKPCFPVTLTSPPVHEERIWPVGNSEQVKELFLTLYSSI